MSGAICPYCRGPIEPDAGDGMVCSGCGAPHHADCYAENGGCTVFGCSAAPPEEPKIHLTEHDLSNQEQIGAAMPAPSLRHLPPFIAGGPPPRINSIPPCIVPGPPIAAPAIDYRAGSQPFNSAPAAKNRVTFAVLGVLLGAFGVHNFYAGYKGKASAQLCITLLTLGLGSPMSWMWAIIDVCTVDRDSKGIKFSS
jgi:TM2 domain-containing membrane protein YozV